MGRLIDAEALIERLQEFEDNDYNKSLGGIFIDCIDICIDYVENAPTAYDAEKVVAELEELKQEKVIGTHKVMIKEAIDIVKRGGVG